LGDFERDFAGKEGKTSDFDEFEEGKEEKGKIWFDFEL
jgi:hypothetical protein